MQKKFLPFLILPVLALASCGGAPSTSVGSQTTQKSSGTVGAQDAGDQTMSAEEAQLLKELNAARAVARVCGTKSMPAAPAVTWNGYLADAARGHALDMAVNGYFAHVSPTYGALDERVKAAGYNGKYGMVVGENIAAGQNVNTVTQAWLKSPSHCETLMDPALKEVGIGYVYRPGSKFGTYFVQDFGTRFTSFD